MNEVIADYMEQLFEATFSPKHNKPEKENFRSTQRTLDETEKIEYKHSQY